MKTFKNAALFIITSISLAMSLSSCTADDDIAAPSKAPVSTNGDYPITNVNVIESGIVKMVVKAEAVTRGNGAQLKAEDFTITNITENEAKALRRSLAEDPEGHSNVSMYAWTTLNYLCNTADGTQKNLSELIVWPYFCGNWCPDQLVVGCHSTITSNDQRPSNFSNLPTAGEINMLALFANTFSQEALVIVPDYEGYGSTAIYPHPYCNRELTAEQVVTGVKAGLSYFTKNVTSMEDNWSGVAIGYSQGGAVAASVLRYCQEHNETSLRLKGAVCGDGPYDPLATLKRYIEMDKMYMPVASALLLKGAVDTDPDVKALNCKYQDFVTDEFYKTGIFETLQNKNRTTDQIQADLLDYSLKHGDDGGFTMRALSNDGFLPYTQSNLVDADGNTRSWELENGKAYNYCTIEQCLRPEVIAYFRDGTVTGDIPENKLKALEHALAKNALTADNFVPGSGFTFFHSVGDEVVPYCNFESVRNTWGVDNIVALSYQSNTTLHVATGTVFYIDYCGSLVNDILKDKWVPREETVGGGLW